MDFMIAKKKMDDYNWPNLYRQADEFMRQYIPEKMITCQEGMTVRAIGNEAEKDYLFGIVFSKRNKEKECYD